MDADNPLFSDAAFEAVIDSWANYVRTERMEHTHIFQNDNGVAGCPTCESIEPYHMTTMYTEKALRSRGGWG